MGSVLAAKDIQLGDRMYRMNELLVNAFASSAPWEDWETWLDPVFRSALQYRPGAFLDVGINLGQTLLKVLSMDASRQYVGFDPQSACCFMVQRFIDENGLGNCRIVPVGLYNADRIVPLYGGSDDFSALATVIDGFRPASFYGSQRYVSVRIGDSVLAEIDLGSVGIVKVDVEGGELEVFEGLERTLKSSMPLLVFEVLNHFIVATGSELDQETIALRESRLQKMELLIRELGYEILNVCPGNQLRNVRKIVPLVSNDMSRTNYLAIAPSELPAFLRVFPGNCTD